MYCMSMTKYIVIKHAFYSITGNVIFLSFLSFEYDQFPLLLQTLWYMRCEMSKDKTSSDFFASCRNF